mgnify:CR=1 FL=1
MAATQDTPTGFSILGGNTGNAFAIDAVRRLAVADAGAIDFENAPSFTLKVAATDGTNTGSGRVTIDVTDGDETPQFIAVGPFSVNDSVADGNGVGDIDAGVGGGADTGVTYAITSGNGSNDTIRPGLAGHAQRRAGLAPMRAHVDHQIDRLAGCQRRQKVRGAHASHSS